LERIIHENVEEAGGYGNRRICDATDGAAQHSDEAGDG
jgi:hypothetical protein